MTAPLIWHIEKFLRVTGMRPSNFGREAAKDPRLVFDLRQGREPGARLATRVQDFMEERGTDPVIKPERPAYIPRRPRRTSYVRPSSPARADAAKALRPVLVALLGGEADMLAHRERPWASATFTGARHYWTFAVTGEHHRAWAQRLEASLPEQEFTLRGHLVADALVTDYRAETLEDGRDATIITLEILTLEED